MRAIFKLCCTVGVFICDLSSGHRAAAPRAEPITLTRITITPPALAYASERVSASSVRRWQSNPAEY